VGPSRYFDPACSDNYFDKSRSEEFPEIKMPPPRNRSNSSLPSPQKVCRYHKYGFCKLKENCPNKHFKKICPGGCSSINACNERHPKTCRYFRDDGFCLNENRCAYKHDDPQKNFLQNCLQSVKDFQSDFITQFTKEILSLIGKEIAEPLLYIKAALNLLVSKDGVSSSKKEDLTINQEKIGRNSPVVAPPSSVSIEKKYMVSSPVPPTPVPNPAENKRKAKVDGPSKVNTAAKVPPLSSSFVSPTSSQSSEVQPTNSQEVASISSGACPPN